MTGHLGLGTPKNWSALGYIYMDMYLHLRREQFCVIQNVHIQSQLPKNISNAHSFWDPGTEASESLLSQKCPKQCVGVTVLVTAGRDRKGDPAQWVRHDPTGTLEQFHHITTGNV